FQPFGQFDRHCALQRHTDSSSMENHAQSAGDPAVLTPLAALSDNYIWLVRKNGRAIVVDPGVAAPVEAALAADGLTLEAILVTHHHNDHVGGLRALQQRTGARVYGPRDETLPLCD